MNTRLLFAGVLSCLLALMGVAAGASDRPGDGPVQVVAEYAYRPFSVEPLQKARSLALFGARAKAAATAAKYLSHAGRLVHLGDRQKEILYLVAEKIEAVVEAEHFSPDTGRYDVRIRAAVVPLDFVHAQIEDEALKEEEQKLSFRDEMEQPILPEIRPGRELSRAYRYLRKKQWRIAVIYLDHLQEKYPNWAEVYLAKAVGYFSLNQTAMMSEALKTACRLGSPEACDDLRGLNPAQMTTGGPAE